MTGRSRGRISDAITGEEDKIDRATMRAIWILADEQDQTRAAADRAANRILSIAATVTASLLATGLLALIRLT